MYAAALEKRQADRAAERGFYETEAALRAGLSARFNPADGARSLGQWLTAVMSVKGEGDAMPVAAAVEMIRATPPNRRSEFAREIWERRKARHGPTGRSGGIPL